MVDEEVKRFLAVLAGDGSGYGSGYGYGDGSGYGYGSGSGYGDGDGIKEYNGQPVYIVDDTPTLIDQVRGSYAKGAILREDLTLQPCFIARVGNSFGHGATLHDAQQAAEEKALEDTPIEERLDKFIEVFPDPDKAVPFADLYKWHHILTGSCKMGRDEFVKARSLDTSKDYTPRYFVTITATSYGSAQIKALAERYGIKL